jgi:hypothetical protein
MIVLGVAVSCVAAVSRLIGIQYLWRAWFDRRIWYFLSEFPSRNAPRAFSFALQNPSSSFNIGPLGGTSDVYLLKIAAVVAVSITEDRYEFNDQSNLASNFGTFNGLAVFDNLNTFKHRNGLFDDDWFTFTTGDSGTLTVNLGEIQTYAFGPTSQTGETGDIHLRVYRKVGGALVEIGSSTNINANGQSVNVNVSAGEQIYVWVYGFYFTQGVYDLILRL